LEKERKLQIIKAAIKRFSKHGIKKTTLDEVARDLRIGKATIYHYFTSKEELYFESLAFETARFIEELNAIFNEAEAAKNIKFTNYFTAKENVPENYKLLYSFLIETINGSLFDNEQKLLTDFLSEEIKIIEQNINPASKSEPPAAETAPLIVNQSWSLLFTSRFTNLNSKETLLKILERFIN
jgi:AcrR family transcriptional regulator